MLPSIGLIAGSLCSARLAAIWPLRSIVCAGILITCCGVISMLMAVYFLHSALLILFVPMIIIYFGLSLVIANASSAAMSHTTDKAHGSAVMNFINMGLTTVVVLCQGIISTSVVLLPMVYLFLSILMLILYMRSYDLPA
jgi:hypothetical protein